MSTENNLDSMTYNEIMPLLKWQYTLNEVKKRSSVAACAEVDRFYRGDNNATLVMNRRIVIDGEEPLAITICFPTDINNRKSTQHVMYLNGSRYLFGPEDSRYDTGERKLSSEPGTKERRLMKIAYEAVRPYIGYPDKQWNANRNIAEVLLGITE